MKAHVLKRAKKKKQKKALKKTISKNPKISKISEIEAEASGVSNIDFENLLQKTSQSQTELLSVLESTTIISSSSINVEETIDEYEKEYLENRPSPVEFENSFEYRQ
ncbi:43333_t:CDS:2 [Gigaspora margarita]|uniref:43333_t:CDS:1 n=1 Tax=Gigaspora margarita TaxID=4874 RepID=A0ABN7UGM9_GIGMA|nr:43333_t:CDS:2 [Gigaspora margarita]